MYQELVSSLSSLEGSSISWAPKLGKQNHVGCLTDSPVRSKYPSYRCTHHSCFDNSNPLFHGLVYHTEVQNQARISHLCGTLSSVPLSKLFKRSILIKLHFLQHASLNCFVSFSILSGTQMKILYARCHLTLLL